MSDDATPRPAHRPAGSARYPRQLAVAMTEDLKRAIQDEAKAATAATGETVSQATIARRWMEAGRTVHEAAQAASDADHG